MEIAGVLPALSKKKTARGGTVLKKGVDGNLGTVINPHHYLRR